MPLHDWTTVAGWDGFHDIWIVELLRHVKPQLPTGYRAYIGAAPALAIGAPSERPDVSVRQWTPEPGPEPPTPPATNGFAVPAPDEEVATLTLDPQTSLFVAAHGRLIAAVELISPRNKDRPSARDAYLARYLSYLHEGAHLLLVDVHSRPLNFSFADALAHELQMKRPNCPPPMTVSYRVGEPAAAGGRMIAVWHRTLAIGDAIPVMPLALSLHLQIPVDLDATYSRAAADVYFT